ncbi:hypothetical protein [Litorilituus sediminis]|uniref:MSHA biogenesis protein MshF n=1 Tax=Litorilituus sediminis TaxID=718192 RepID=A0A4P6PAE4_9GAMM|nr:hypothetical protein [Litorilituus sediminis]QBG36602.1 hypothetical protein EMK97_13170 [Litorilituus sediminis]
MTDNVEKREKSLAEFIVIVILMASLMAIFIYYFFKQEQQVASAGFNNIAQNFNATVLAVHAQWLMAGKPKLVYLAQLNQKDKQRITVNKLGWLDAEPSHGGSSACHNIWQQTMQTPLSLMKMSIAVVEIQKGSADEFHHCRYLLSSGQYFDYFTGTGKVSKIYQNE